MDTIEDIDEQRQVDVKTSLGLLSVPSAFFCLLRIIVPGPETDKLEGRINFQGEKITVKVVFGSFLNRILQKENLLFLRAFCPCQFKIWSNLPN